LEGDEGKGKWTFDVQNLTKLSDVRFPRSKPNWPQNSKTENSVSAARFPKTDFGGTF